MKKFKHNWLAGVMASVVGLATMAASAPAHASMTLLLEQPYGKLGVVDPGGHSAIYLDRVCAETPIKLRPCEAGELGIVLSRYDGIQGLDWVAVPLIPYLYAVETEDEIPSTMDKGTEATLRDAYRRRHLESVAKDREDGSAPDGNWYELVGSSYDRTIYGFRVATTADQDAMLIAVYNDQKNTERYNGVYRNCADFVRVAINRVYHHAIRRNYIADLGVSSPKSAARGLTHYAHKHPEVQLDVFVIPQVPGDLPRSHGNTGVLEGVVKRYSVPLVLLSPHIEGVALVAYVAHGRFAMPKDPPKLDLAELQRQLEITRPFPMGMPQMPDAQQPTVMRQGVGLAVTSGSNGVAATTVAQPVLLQ
jgi:hypothetical protein